MRAAGAGGQRLTDDAAVRGTLAEPEERDTQMARRHNARAGKPPYLDKMLDANRRASGLLTNKNASVAAMRRRNGQQAVDGAVDRAIGVHPLS